MTDCKFEAGKTYPLRGGGTAEILKVGAYLSDGRTIVGIMSTHLGDINPTSWFAGGSWRQSSNSDYDLMPPEPKRESGWLNIYPKSSNIEQIVCRSRDNADFLALATRTHVLELVYEDGVFAKSIAHKV